jgi:hypothetical protein
MKSRYKTDGTIVVNINTLQQTAASSRHPPRQGSLLVEVAALPQAIMIGAALTAPEFFSEF